MDDRPTTKITQIVIWLTPLVVGTLLLAYSFTRIKTELAKQGLLVHDSFLEVLFRYPLTYLAVTLLAVPLIAYVLPRSISPEHKFRVYLYGSLLAIGLFLIYYTLII